MYARRVDRHRRPADQQPAITAGNGRTFATFPAAVVVPLVDRAEQILLLESKRRPGFWEPVNGAVERGETLVDAALREVHEEAGPDVCVRPLGVAHATTFVYDARVDRMISVVYVMRYEGGQVLPGDDMRGSQVRWAGLREIDADALQLIPPLDHAWLRRRVIDISRLWDADSPDPLQAGI